MSRISITLFSIDGLPFPHARIRMLFLSGFAFGILPREKSSSLLTAIILKSLYTKKDENCHNFSNLPLLSAIRQTFESLLYAVMR